MNELPEKLREIITEARQDIEFIHFDEAYYEDATSEWIIPCEALFKAEDGFEPGECGWNHGNMRVEYDPAIDLLDHFVGDWTPGMHPDLHTFER